MRKIGKRGNLSEPKIIQYVIDGIQDYESNKTILYGAKTYAEFKDKMVYYEAIKSKVGKGGREKPAAKTTSGHESATKGASNTGPAAKEAFTTPTPRCYNCRETGHLSRNCAHKESGAKCFKCNEFGHISRNCTKPGARGPSARGTNQSEKTSGTTASTSQVLCVGAGLNRVYKTIRIGEKDVTSRVDTASDYHLMHVDQYLELGSPNYDPETEALKGPKNVKIRTMSRCKIDMVVDKVNYPLTYHMVNVDNIPDRVMIDSEILDVAELHIKKNETKVIKLSEGENLILNIEVENEIKNVEIGLDVSVACRNEVKRLVDSYKPNKTMESPIKLKIILKDEKPIWQGPRRLTEREKHEVDEQIGNWLETGIIKPSYSEFASPIVVARKKKAKPECA
ncbi:uncharacterized protein [Temnothorax longispinosus]|uniref:uncharacterized protein n=1 Tax=Temnothorax longispinosus TaxID=300112 RepID=UPI003A99AB18